MSTTYQQQPSANQLKQEKSHSQPPSACHLITLQHLASPIQPILPTRPTVCLPFVISSLLKTKNTNPHAGGASAAVVAGLSPETGGGRGPSPGTGTTSLQDPSLDHEAVPGPMTENKGMCEGVKGAKNERLHRLCRFMMDFNFVHFCVGFFKTIKHFSVPTVLLLL
nr:PREDICTED: serine/arginine-rich splicing factor 3 isoform X2 [Paralichthys olivaceus]